MGIDIEPPMPPKRLAQRDLESEQKKSSGFFSLFKKKKSSVDIDSPEDDSSFEIRKKLGLDGSNSLSVQKLHEQLQQEADSFSDEMSKQYEKEQQDHKEEPLPLDTPIKTSNASMVPDDLLSTQEKPSNIDSENKVISPKQDLNSTPDAGADVDSLDSSDEISTNIVNDSEPVHEEENIDLQKEIDSSSSSSNNASMVPDFLVEEFNSNNNSDDKSEKSSDKDSSWAEDELVDAGSDSESSFASEPEEIINTASAENDGVFPTPLSLKDDSESTSSLKEKDFDSSPKEVPVIDEQQNDISKKEDDKDTSFESKDTLTNDSSDDLAADSKNSPQVSLKKDDKMPSKSQVPDFLVDDSQDSLPSSNNESISDSSFLDEPSDNITTNEPDIKNSFTDEPDPITVKPSEPENLNFSSSTDSKADFSQINLDSDKANAFADELSLSAESVAKEHSIHHSPASPFDENPAPDLSKSPVIDRLDDSPTLTNFEKPKKKKKGFFSSLFGSKDKTPKNKTLSSPIPDIKSPHPLDLAEESSAKKESDVHVPFPTPEFEDKNTLKNKETNVKVPESSSSQQDFTTPIEAHNPYVETPDISKKRASTLSSIIDSGKLDVLFVDKNGSVASNEDELVELKLNSDEELFDEDAKKTKKHHRYISSFAHDVDIIINSAKDAISNGDLILAKKKYNEAKELYSASELEDHTRELLYVTLRDLFDEIHLKLLEQQAQELLDN